MKVSGGNRKKPRKPRKRAYTKKAVNDAFREVQTKMRKEVTKLQKIKTPIDNISKGGGDVFGSNVERAFNAGMKRMSDIGMKARAARTKAISAASKKHGVPKSKITAKKPINPGEIASKTAGQWRAKYRW